MRGVSERNETRGRGLPNWPCFRQHRQPASLCANPEGLCRPMISRFPEQSYLTKFLESQP